MGNEKWISKTDTLWTARNPDKKTNGLCSFECDVCGRAFSRDKVTRYNGLDYGIPCGCSKDIDGIRQLEQPADNRDRTRSDLDKYNI